MVPRVLPVKIGNMDKLRSPAAMTIAVAQIVYGYLGFRYLPGHGMSLRNNQA